MQIDKIYCGDALEVLKTFPDNSIDCCVTSPPYWGQRNYNEEGQIGQEQDFKQFIAVLIEIFAEVKRVLKPTGTCFVNLGDTYGGSGAGTTKNVDTEKYIENSKQVYVLPNGDSKSSILRSTGLNKSLLLIPERFAISMLDLGWICRNHIVWHKPNQMPQSATDRFTGDFEDIYFFTKISTGYYFEQQLEPYTKPLDRWAGNNLEAKGESEWDKGADQKAYRNRNMRPNEEGKNMRTVWSINTEPFGGGHFATYPEKLVERILKAGCPEEVCIKCGVPKQKLFNKENTARTLNGGKNGFRMDEVKSQANKGSSSAGYVTRTEAGETDCGCNAGYKKGIVLDPFSGAGTTALVAKKLNRNYVGIELNPKYITISEKRIYDKIGLFN